MLMCTDLQWNALVQIIFIKQLFLLNVLCVCKFVNPCATLMQVLCVEHGDCA